MLVVHSHWNSCNPNSENNKPDHPKMSGTMAIGVGGVAISENRIYGFSFQIFGLLCYDVVWRVAVRLRFRFLEDVGILVCSLIVAYIYL